MITNADPANLGLPLTIPIDNHKRYSYCSAYTAFFTGIEGDKAIYQGECNCGHIYREEVQLNEAQLKKLQSVAIVNGTIQYGEDIGYDADPLEEF
jgi:hypothetical protein